MDSKTISAMIKKGHIKQQNNLKANLNNIYYKEQIK